MVALVLLAIAAAINFSGTRNLSRAVTAGLVAEIIGVAGIGLYLVLLDRNNPFGVVFNTSGDLL